MYIKEKCFCFFNRCIFQCFFRIWNTFLAVGILVNVQCYIYLCISLDKLYKLMGIFFKFRNPFWIIGRKQNLKSNSRFFFQFYSTFDNCQKLFLKNRKIIYHSKSIWEYIPKSNSSVCTRIFKLAGLCFYPKSLIYTSMDSSWRTLQTNDFFFQSSNSFSYYRPKTENYSNKLQGVSINQSTMCYTSMD